MNKIIYPIVAILYFISTNVFAADTASPAIKPTTSSTSPSPVVKIDNLGTGISNVQSYTLPNGLKILVKEDHNVPVAVVQLWYKVGSSYEPTGITGISHAVEHMMFEGSLHYPKDTYVKIVSSNGGTQNAVTDYDYTFYYQTIASDKLPLALQMEADRMQNLTLSKDAFAKEIQVVKEERRMRLDNNPQGLTSERFFATAFISSPYHHSPVGWMEDLNSMTIDDLKQWYHQWYRPNNATLIVVGDVVPAKVYELAQKYFGSIPAVKLPVIKSTLDQTPLGIRGLKVAIPSQLPWAILGYNVPALASVAANQKWQAYALLVLTNLLVNNHGINGRLNRDLVRGSQIATDVDTSYNLYSRLPTLLTIAGTPNAGHTAKEVTAAIIGEIKALQTTLVPEAELQQVKNQMIANKTYSRDDLTNQAVDIGTLESVGLPWQETNNFVTQIQQVTPQQIMAVARQYLVENRLTVGELVPLATTTTSMPSIPAKRPAGVPHVH